MPRPLNGCHSCRDLPLNRSVVDRPAAARTAPVRFHLPDHGLDRFTDSLEFVRHLNHHLHCRVSSIGFYR
jgi:hypothetical protein